MDLFNPPLEFNYKQMSHNLEVEKLDNPYVQVVWEDTPDNFTSERIKNVKQYFQKKYLTTNVNVITRVKNVEDTMQSVDVSFNILDKNYQHELIKSYLTSKSLDKSIWSFMTSILFFSKISQITFPIPPVEPVMATFIRNLPLLPYL